MFYKVAPIKNFNDFVSIIVISVTHKNCYHTLIEYDRIEVMGG